MPLQTLINPTVVNDLINSLVEIAEQSGNEYLERWELLNAYSVVCWAILLFLFYVMLTQKVSGIMM